MSVLNPKLSLCVVAFDHDFESTDIIFFLFIIVSSTEHHPTKTESLGVFNPQPSTKSPDIGPDSSTTR